MLFDGEYSHAVVKRPKAGDFRVQEHLGGMTVPPAPPGGIALPKPLWRPRRRGSLCPGRHGSRTRRAS